jgi:hypothetical protein
MLNCFFSLSPHLTENTVSIKNTSYGETRFTYVDRLLFLYGIMHSHLWTKFNETTTIRDFTKIRPAGSELFHADKRTDRQA